MDILENARLVDISKEHLPLVLSWRNQDHIRNLMYNDKIISFEEHMKWFERVKEQKDIVKIFYIDQKPLGVININKIDNLNKVCEWGFYIGPTDTPKGIGTIMGYTALNYIFDSLDMCKLHAEVIGYNIRSIKFHEKLGFSTEARLLNHVPKKAGFADVILMGLYKKYWDKQKKEIENMIEGKSL